MTGCAQEHHQLGFAASVVAVVHRIADDGQSRQDGQAVAIGGEAVLHEATQCGSLTTSHAQHCFEFAGLDLRHAADDIVLRQIRIGAFTYPVMRVTLGRTRSD